MSTHDVTGKDGGASLSFSRRLVAYHVSAVIILVAVLAGSLIWVSDQHNQLARISAEKMVRGGVTSFEEGLQSIVRDYSVWTEAYRAIRAHDIDWVYNNIGTGASEIGAVDMIVIIDPDGEVYGWRAGSPAEGEADLLSPRVLDPLLDRLETVGPQAATPVLYVRLNGSLWAFTAMHVVPTEGLASDARAAALPWQVHGIKVTDALLGEIGANFLMQNLALGPPEARGVPLPGASGEPLAHVVWTPPVPGREILERVAFPLVSALLALIVIASVLSRFAVRSARRLERALVAAQAASRGKSEFLASVSHELRTPMHGIIGLGQLLEETSLDPQQRHMLGALMQAARAQTALIGDLLDISAIESGRRTLEFEPFEPGSVLRDVTELARPAAEAKGLTLTVETDGMSREVIGDVVAFRQVLTNLVGNAVKFVETGRIEVRGRLAVRQGEGVCTVAVSDTGPGIDLRDHARIFDRFTQADASLSRKTGGAGLGLWISRRLAGMMGGTITVESAPGEGSTFVFEARFDLAADLRPRAEAA